MKIVAEVIPGRVHGLSGYLPDIAGLADAIDIPESPLGIPHPNSVATAAFIKAAYGCEVIPHVRLADLSEVSLLSLAYAARAYGAYGLVILRGEGGGGSFASSEDAAKAVHSAKGLEGLKLGAILSLRFNDGDILTRAAGSFEFFLVTRLNPRNPLGRAEVLEAVRGLGKEVFPYIIVATPENADVVTRVGQPCVNEERLPELVEVLEGVVDGVIVSVPHDRAGLLRCLKALRRR